MADPDKGLVNLFVRDLDDIELPPRDRWRPAPRKESSLMKTTRFVLAATAVAAVIALALIASAGLRDRNQVAATPSPTSLPTTSPTPVPSSATTTAASSATPSPTGAVTGNLGYPSDFIPPLTVYAISVADQRVFFSVDTPRYGADPSVPPTAAPPGPRPSYTITGVAPGTYYVLAWRNDDVNAKDHPGVYSQFVLQCIQVNESHAGESGYTPPPACGSPGDHTLVPVTVRPGETVSRIDVTDWYYQQATTYPPRPR
jgi:hypothetical protein